MCPIGLTTMELEWRSTAAASIGAFRIGSLVQYRVAILLIFADGLTVTKIDYCVPIQASAA
jgi:hypothetical protein